MTDGLPPLATTLVRTAGGRRFVFRHVSLYDSDAIVVTAMDDREQREMEILRALGLTLREASVVRALREGTSNSAIAVRLGVSRSAVKRHLEFHNRSQAVALVADALTHG
jgi:DNA-binding NarL/FixJ family response regulator